MTTNIDRAAQVILQSTACTATEVSQALADAGLLMPDPPEPDRHGCLWPRHGGGAYGHVQSPRFTTTGNVIIARGAGSIVLTCEEALELASLLTAAALEEA